MIHKLLAAFFFSVTAMVVHALDTPNRSQLDSRIQTTPYNVNDVVLIRAAVGRAAHIVLSPSEEVQEMATGNSEAWEIKDSKNNIYMKPKMNNAETNLIVTTNRRVYSFDLRVVESQPTYRLTFTYPDEQAAANNKKMAAEKVKLSFETPPKIANQNYTMAVGQNSEEIRPMSAFDDGTFTYIKFKRGQEMPVVFKKADDGSEEIINTHVKGDWVVLHGVYKKMMLRAGSAVIALHNDGYVGGSVGTQTGTTSELIHREVVEDKE